MVTVARPFIILLLSRLHLFFSLFSVHNKLSNFSSPHLLFPQMHTNTSTHKHIHIDKSTQRYTCSKKHTHTHTHTHRYTNTPTHKQTHTNKQQRDRLVLDRCLTGTIGARGYGSCLIESREISDLIGACGSELGSSVLMDRCLIGSYLIGAVDRCL